MVPLFFVRSDKGYHPEKVEVNYRRWKDTLIAYFMPQNHPFAASQFFSWKYFFFNPDPRLIFLDFVF